MFGDEPFVYTQGWQGRFPGWSTPPVGTVLRSFWKGQLQPTLYVVTRKGIQKVYPDGTTPEGPTGTGGDWKVLVLGTGRVLSPGALKVLQEKVGKTSADHSADWYIMGQDARGRMGKKRNKPELVSVFLPILPPSVGRFLWPLIK